MQAKLEIELELELVLPPYDTEANSQNHFSRNRLQVDLDYPTRNSVVGINVSALAFFVLVPLKTGFGGSLLAYGQRGERRLETYPFGTIGLRHYLN